MSRAQDVVDRAIKEIESEAKRLRAEIDKQRQDLEKRIKPLQDQLTDLEDALQRLARRDAQQASTQEATNRPPCSARSQQTSDPRRPQEAAGASAAEIAAATGIKSTVVSSSLTGMAKQGEVKRTRRNGRVTWKTAA